MVTMKGVSVDLVCLSSGFPELIEPKVEPGEAGGRNAVDAAGALGLDVDQTGVEQNLEVLGDGRPRYRQAGGQLADRLRTPAEFLEEVAPVRVGYRQKGIGEGHSLFLRKTD